MGGNRANPQMRSRRGNHTLHSQLCADALPVIPAPCGHLDGVWLRSDVEMLCRLLGFLWGKPRKSEQYMDLSSPNSLTASFAKDKSPKQPDLGHVSFGNVWWYTAMMRSWGNQVLGSRYDLVK